VQAKVIEMKLSDIKNFKLRLDQLSNYIETMNTLSDEDWASIDEAAQEDLVREAVALRNRAKAMMERYYDW
jgi:hypothetical protein